MKRWLFFSALLIVAFCGCDKEDASDSREETVTVASKRIYFNEPVGPIELFYLVRFDGTESWKAIRTIRNFAYETGYEYRIRMRITEYEPEPGLVVDSDPTLYECLEVLSRERKSSTGLPGGAVDE